MNATIYRHAILALVSCISMFAAEPYRYRLVEKSDYSYSNVKRFKHSIYLETQDTPTEARMRATAEAIWKDGNKT